MTFEQQRALLHSVDCIYRYASEAEKKAQEAVIRIQHAIHVYGSDSVALACSFGKDSMLVLYLARKVCPDINVVWCDTKCENERTYKFQSEITKKWNLNLHIARAPSGVNFWSIAKEHGLPGIRGYGTNRVPACCQILKDGPAEEVYKKLGTKCVITGITAEESHQRFMLAKRNENKAQAAGISCDDPSGEGCGALYYGKTKDRWTLNPIVWMTEEEIWQCHKIFDIPHCGVYDLCKGARVGCDPCTAYKSWMDRMPIQAPKTFKRVRSMMGIVNLDDFKGGGQS